MTSTPPRHIVLLGLMGSGKTTVGRLLARRLGRPFVDSDAQLAATDGRTARRIEAEEGPAALDREEADALLAALRSPTPSVIAAAAGVVEDARAVDALRAGGILAVWLRGDPVVLAERAASGAHRPWDPGGPLATLERQADRRDPTYEALATLDIDVTRTSPEQAVARVMERLAGPTDRQPEGR
jgi:shikimate kinase